MTLEGRGLNSAALKQTTEPPQLRLLVNTETGEVLEEAPQDERDVLITELEGKLRGSYLREGLLKKEIRELQAVEPEHEVIREVLDYWRERCKPRATFVPGSERWKKVRARLREKPEGRGPLTSDELKLAVDGALTDRWHTQSGMAHRLDADWLFRSYESVEKLRDLALGFEARAGIELGDLLDVIDQFSYVPWKDHLRVCICGCRRISHSRGDPNHEGRQGCLAAGCDCTDWDEDPHDNFNQRVDPWLREHFGRAS